MRVKLTVLLFLLSFGLNQSFAQILDPAHWSYNTSVDKATVGQEIDIVFKVVIDDTWYVYSSDFSKDVGPKVTEFHYEPNDSYELVGEIKAINPKQKYDDVFEGDVRYFEHEAEFRQTIKILTTDLVVKGDYEYQTCTTVDGKCIPGDGEFEISGLNITMPVEKAASKQEKDNTKVTEAPVESPKIETKPQVVEKKEAEVLTPATAVEGKPLTKIEAAQSMDTTKSVAENPKITPSKSKVSASVVTGGDSIQKTSLWGFAILAFLAGLAALLTPCVFPMIPMTVTFFTGSSSNRTVAIRKAVIYGLSIIVIYSVVGTLLAWINGPGFANWLSTHWLPNLFFFGVFVIFALSFLGLFEITLPSRFVNKVDSKADKGGLTGIFFMAFTIVLVSFSCTGPIVGSILVASAGGAIVKPIVGMFAFSLAFAIPFTLFAIFPQWLSQLPKSGGWLNSVKVVLGFLELALGLKFLSIADQVYHWNLLDREVYLAIWIVIFALIGFYLLGKIILPNDSKLEKVSVSRLMLAIASFTFVVYLIPGMFGAPLKALAGYLPPMSTMDFNLPGLMANANTGQPQQANTLCEEPRYGDVLHFPHGIQGYFDLDQAIKCSQEQQKPIFIDFTGHGCVNCREMEARVWSDPKVLSRLKNDYIMVALYVDEKSDLPESEWYVSEYDGKTKKTIGKQNTDYQIRKFNNNAQPFYVLMDGDENVLIEPKAYDLDIDRFVQFLDEGVKKYNQNLVTKR
ncbi:MAG TPA: cytochrome c biogenesis protein CcdA [Fulvivirga sp.]|nr:cytochrome c biogenesis protein CcdA [Fulvivirga sp.]